MLKINDEKANKKYIDEDDDDDVEDFKENPSKSYKSKQITV